MKAVILAAGKGSRLGGLLPKALTSLKGKKTILDYQIENLASVVGAENIIVVVGYKHEIFKERFPDLTYAYNEAYAATNTSKSLLCAVKMIIREDVLWLNGDVFFDAEALRLLLDCDRSSCLVNNEKCGEEEIKYNLDEDGYVRMISKQVTDGKGEALGINLIRKEDLELFKKELEVVDNNDYFEKALENLTLKKKLKLKAVNIGPLFCAEIDFPDDLRKVQEHIKSMPKTGMNVENLPPWRALLFRVGFWRLKNQFKKFIRYLKNPRRFKKLASYLKDPLDYCLLMAYDLRRKLIPSNELNGNKKSKEGKVHCLYFSCGKHFKYLILSLKSLEKLKSKYIGNIYIYVDKKDPFSVAQVAELKNNCTLNVLFKNTKFESGRGIGRIINELTAFTDIGKGLAWDEYVAKIDSDVLFLSDNIFMKIFEIRGDLIGHPYTNPQNVTLTEGGCYFLSAPALIKITHALIRNTIIQTCKRNRWHLNECREDLAIFNLVNKEGGDIKFIQFHWPAGKISEMSFVDRARFSIIHFWWGDKREKEYMEEIYKLL